MRNERTKNFVQSKRHTWFMDEAREWVRGEDGRAERVRERVCVCERERERERERVEGFECSAR
jgi:hypothetical protein